MQYDFDTLIDRKHNHAAKYDEMEAKFGTRDLLPLWVADMDFPASQPVLDAIYAKADQRVFGYTTRPDSYFEAFAQWQEKRHGWTADPALMSHCHGVVPALSTCVYEFTKPGGSVLVQTPVYAEFFDVIEAWDRTILKSPLREDPEKGYVIDFEDFEEKLKQHPGLFIFCNPHNPVGRVWTREEILRVTELCHRYGVRVVSDEIHGDLVWKGHTHVPTASVSDTAARITITCTAASKTFNLAGLQSATIIHPDLETKSKFEKFWSGLDLRRNNCFSVVAMEAAMREGEDWLDQLLVYLEDNIDYICNYIHSRIPQIKVRKPEATYLLWLDCRALGLSPEELGAFMVRKAGLALNAGEVYDPGLHGFMRLNAACPRFVLEKAMAQLETAVAGLE